MESINNKTETDFWWNNRAALLSNYNGKLNNLNRLLLLIQEQLKQLVQSTDINGLVKSRVKEFNDFYRKLLLRCRTQEIDDPFAQITDLLGMRIVTPFAEDLQALDSLIKNEFNVVEVDYKSSLLSTGEFGYDSIHMLVLIDDDILEAAGCTTKMVAEIQLRTILQEAWAEVEHELAYKATIDGLDENIRRKLHALNATLSLADTIFQEIRDHQRKRYDNLKKRHQNLMDKVSTIPEKMGMGSPDDISDSTEAKATIKKMYAETLLGGEKRSLSLDDILIQALHAHLENDLELAIDLYNQVLAVNPTSAVFNHRGLAYLALSDYEKAIEDFTRSLELNPNDMRAYTNRGLARRMVQQLPESLEDFNRSLELNPMWSDTFYGRSLTNYDMGNIKAAIQDCDRAIAINQDFKQALKFKNFLHNLDI